MTAGPVDHTPPGGAAAWLVVGLGVWVSVLAAVGLSVAHFAWA